jgi:uncharacterized protein (TIGR03435 family)
VWPVLWFCGSAFLVARWLVRWLRIRALLRVARPSSVPAPIPVKLSDTLLEPGVFGIFRPVLLLPAGIETRLTSEQLDAVVAHELCHVRRRDNLTAALHMIVEAVFWFHPLVWWIGARLLEERERACDEEVLRLGNRPETYAEGIVNVCRCYVESPLACASGVSGSDLKKRIAAIMSGRAARRLTLPRKLLLAIAATAALAPPLILGMLKAPQLDAQTPPADRLRFDVASIRPSDPNQEGGRLGPVPGGGLRVNNGTLQVLIQFAYNVREYQLSGAPSWIRTARFDIVAKLDQPEGPADFKDMTPDQHTHIIARLRERTRNLLAERFGLRVRRDSKELPVFALVVSRPGRLKASDEKSEDHMRAGRGQINAGAATMQMLAEVLSNLTGRRVLDQTGVSGKYDFRLAWTPDYGTSLPGKLTRPDAPDPADIPGAISIFTAIEEQLGLKLESKRAPTEVIVIDRVEKPSEN